MDDPATIESCSASVSETLAEVASRMRFRNVARAIIYEHDLVVGVLTERDLTRAAADGADPQATTAREYMTPARRRH